MENIIGSLETLIQEKIDGDVDFQAELETLSDEDKLRLKNKQAFIVKAVVLHNNPDLDGIAAYWLALRHPKDVRI